MNGIFAKWSLMALAILAGAYAQYQGAQLYADGVSSLSETEISVASMRFWAKSGGPGLILVVAGAVVQVFAVRQRIAEIVEEHDDGTPGAGGGRRKKSSTFGQPK